MESLLTFAQPCPLLHRGISLCLTLNCDYTTLNVHLGFLRKERSHHEGLVNILPSHQEENIIVLLFQDGFVKSGLFLVLLKI